MMRYFTRFIYKVRYVLEKLRLQPRFQWALFILKPDLSFAHFPAFSNSELIKHNDSRVFTNVPSISFFLFIYEMEHGSLTTKAVFFSREQNTALQHRGEALLENHFRALIHFCFLFVFKLSPFLFSSFFFFFAASMLIYQYFIQKANGCF